MTSPTRISVVNQSILFADADLPALVNALQVQVTRDFYPAWGIGAQLFYTPSGKQPTADHWVLALLDDADVSGALGYHDLTPTGQPLGKIFVRTTQSDGSSVSVTASHELLEMLCDPDINLTAELDDASGAPSKFYAYEVGDPVEADNLGYEIVIPAGWTGAGTSILVSDFVLPSWFESFRTTGPFAFKTQLTAPFQLAAGGYNSILDLANLSAGWTQVQARTDAKAAMKARPHQGSRRERRKLPRSQWIRSTYPAGAIAIPADSGPLTAPRFAMQENRMKKIDRLKVSVTVADFPHILTAEQAIADMNLQASYVEVDLSVDNNFTPPSVSQVDQDALNAVSAQTQDVLTEATALETQVIPPTQP